MLHYAAYISNSDKYKGEFLLLRIIQSHINRLIDETNEYKFPASDASDTNKKPDKYFLLKKIILNYLKIDSSMIVWIGIKY